MSRSSTLILALACTLPLAGCPSGHGNVSLDQIDDELAGATCDYAARCQGSALARALGGTSCLSIYQPLVDEQFLAQIRAAVAAGTVAYHGDQAGQCLDQFDGLSCDAPSFTGPAACNLVFEGLVADGQACNIEQECGATSTCDTSSATGCPRGTCRHIAQLGEACSSGTPGMGCDGGLRCASGVCAHYAVAGETCTAGGNECNAGLTCSATTGTGTCTTPSTAQLGEACTSSPCASGLVCVANAAGTGAECAQPRTDGTCRYGFGGTSECPSSQVCSATFGMEGTCGPPPGEGQMCTGTCGDGLSCASPPGGGSAVCVRRHHVGESCTIDSTCFSGYCNGGTCAAAPLCRT